MTYLPLERKGTSRLSLIEFVCSIEHGVGIKSHLANGTAKSDLGIAQLFQHNCYAKPKEGSGNQRHSKDRETPFTVYVDKGQKSMADME